MRAFGKTLLKLFLFLCVFGLIATGVFLFAFNRSTEISYSKSNSFLSETVDSINKANGSIESIGPITSIDSSLKLEIEDARDSLIEQRNILREENMPVKYEDLSKNILSGLEFNINIYKGILKISNAKSSNELQSILENLNRNANKCINYYDKTSSSSFKVEFPENIQSLITNIQTYILNEKTVLDKKLIENSLKEKYIQEINVVYLDFLVFYQNRIKDSLLATAKKDNSYADLIAMIDDEVKSINGLMKQVTPIIPAPESQDITEELHTLLYDYVMYLQFFKHAVSFEMNSTDMIKDDVKTQLESFYATSTENLKKCESNYKTFESLFQKLKRTVN